MTKSALRSYYKNVRKTLSKDEVLSFSTAITEKLIDNFLWKKGNKVHIFLPIEKFNEVNTHFFIDYLQSVGVEIFVPRVVGDDMQSIPYDPKGELEISKWGIPEPTLQINGDFKQFDYVILPLLYADNKGNRVGYGKGFYDRFLNKIQSNVVRIGVNFFSPTEDIEDVESTDIPLDYLVTPTEVLSFNGSV